MYNSFDNSSDFDAWPHEQEAWWLSINKGQAEIHMMALAECMWDEYNKSTPKQLNIDDRHIPFSDNIDEAILAETSNDIRGITEFGVDELKLKVATARCARVSYTVVGEENKEPNYENDLKLHDRLAKSGHWSPFEHCAKAMNGNDIMYSDTNNGIMGWSGNFKGFIQYRKMFDNENITKK